MNWRDPILHDSKLSFYSKNIQEKRNEHKQTISISNMQLVSPSADKPQKSPRDEFSRELFLTLLVFADV